MDNIIQSLKKLIWDIIGYLVPGLFLIILLNLFVAEKNLVKQPFLFDWNIFQNYLIILLGYIFGYLVYSLTKYKIYLQDIIIKYLILISEYFTKKYNIFNYCTKFLKKRHSSFWMDDFKKSQTYKAVLLKYNDEIPNIESMEINEVRNILMTKNDRQAQLIYTFMFRSSMFDHISTLFLLILILLSGQYIFNLEILKTGIPYNYLYTAMLGLIPLLGNCKRFFYPKAIRIPFSNL